MSDIATPRGKGLVISGALVAGVPLVFAIVWATFAAANGVFADALITLTTIGLPFVSPTWFLGVALLAIGRSRQRGPVKASVVAWIVALAAVPAAILVFIVAYSTSLDALYAGASEPLPPVGNYAVVALMGLPTVGLLLASAASGATWVFYALIAAIPLSIVAMIGGLAWLVWGKPVHAM